MLAPITTPIGCVLVAGFFEAELLPSGLLFLPLFLLVDSSSDSKPDSSPRDAKQFSVEIDFISSLTLGSVFWTTFCHRKVLGLSGLDAGSERVIDFESTGFEVDGSDIISVGLFCFESDSVEFSLVLLAICLVLDKVVFPFGRLSAFVTICFILFVIGNFKVVAFFCAFELLSRFYSVVALRSSGVSTADVGVA